MQTLLPLSSGQLPVHLVGLRRQNVLSDVPQMYTKVSAWSSFTNVTNVYILLEISMFFILSVRVMRRRI